MSNTDITYWMNDIVVNDANDSSTTADEGNNSIKYGTINTAVEATTLNQRTYHLLPQDKFIRDNIKEDDVLIVSIGGNDIALAPTPCTIISILSLICCVPYTIVDRGHACCSLPIDDYCYGCCTSFLSCFGACPPCLGYFRHLFCTRVQKYVEALTSKTKPKKVLVCMIYYPDESNTPSWANTALTALGYNSNPEKLQMLIRKIFEEAISRITISNTEVIPVPLFNVLDGKNSNDYIARVEPSATGGRKMAEFLLDIIHRSSSSSGYDAPPSLNVVNRS